MFSFVITRRPTNFLPTPNPQRITPFLLPIILSLLYLRPPTRSRTIVPLYHLHLLRKLRSKGLIHLLSHTAARYPTTHNLRTNTAPSRHRPIEERILVLRSFANPSTTSPLFLRDLSPANSSDILHLLRVSLEHLPIKLEEMESRRRERKRDTAS